MDSLPDLDSFPTHQERLSSFSAPATCDDLGIIDVSQMDFKDDETWLVETSNESNIDAQKCLYGNDDSPQTNPKIFDSRTFTRKRVTRPSIFTKSDMTEGGLQLPEGSPPLSTPKPLHFDLGQTTGNAYFENILVNATSTLDSFVNMSPPSLVNSMCSSTFTNLMESSFIKNDPVLREIRDTDYTQENEPLSRTESCSSLNSDLIESLLKNGTEEELNLVKNAERAADTFLLAEETPHEETITVSKEFSNRTFQCKKDTTFDQQKNRTLTLSPKGHNATITLEADNIRKLDDKPFENVKRLLDRRPSPSMDLNRLSYITDNVAIYDNKRNSFGSTDSMENGDYMSLSSGSSKSSHRGSINIQEKCLHHINSTPKTTIHEDISRWPTSEFSPISGRNSDPELSSIEKSKPVINITNNTIRKQKSVGQLNRQVPDFRKANSLQQDIVKGSHPNLKLSGLRKLTNLNSMGHTLKGSYTSLKPLNTNLPVAPPPLQQVVKPEAPQSDDAQFSRPRSVRPSALPRPVSRIPGSRSVRPPSKSAGHQGRY